MNFAKRLGPAEISRPLAMDVEENLRVLPRGKETFRQVENDDDEVSADSLRDLLIRVSETSTREIDNVIGELQTLRKRLDADSTRIQRDIAKFAGLSGQVMQVTKIVSESVQKLPEAPNISP